MPDVLTKVDGKHEYIVDIGDADVPCGLHIGGKDEQTAGKFVPLLYSRRFRGKEQGLKDDEAWLSLNHAESVVSAETESFAAGRIDLTVGKVTHSFWKLNADDFEWEMGFSTQPASNVVNLQARHSTNITWNYQPALSSDEIADGASRPAHIEGSYAVYARERWRLRSSTGGEIVNYKAGKVLHIHRPKVIDASSDAAWCELSYSPSTSPGQGTLSVTMPSTWLGGAKYPIRLDPSFGYTSVGGTVHTINADQASGFGRYTPASNGTVTHITVYASTDESGNDITCGLYKDNGGTVQGSTLLGDSAGTEGGGSTAWSTHAMDAGIAVLSSTNYYLATNQSLNFSYAYDASAGYERERDPVGYVAGSLLSTFGTVAGTNADREYSIYATYTAASTGANTLPPRAAYIRRMMG